MLSRKLVIVIFPHLMLVITSASRIFLTNALAFASVQIAPKSIVRYTSTSIICHASSSVSSSIASPSSLVREIHHRQQNQQCNRKNSLLPGSSTQLSMSSSSSPSPPQPGLSDIGSTSQGPTTPESPTTTADNLTSWRDKINISIQRSRKVRGGNFVQISTVDRITFEPRCRTVVFRGFLLTGTNNNNNNQPQEMGDDDTTIDLNTMKMITDRRSSKVTEVSNGGANGHGPKAELLWWFQKSNEQYRIRGELEFVGHDHPNPALVTARKGQWGNLSDSAREQFYWKDPGLPFGEEGEGGVGGGEEIPEGGRNAEGKVVPPPDDFLLMLLHPRRVDYLRLGDNVRQVDELALGKVDSEGGGGDGWSMTRMNP